MRRLSIPAGQLLVRCRAGTPFIGVDPAGGVGADRSTVVVRNRKQILEVFASEWHGLNVARQCRLGPIWLRNICTGGVRSRGRES